MDEDMYVEHLRALFDSCDVDSQGMLCKDELQLLCNKLQLDSEADLLIECLLQDDSSKVTFEEFKESFVSLLSSSVQDVSDEVAAGSLEQTQEVCVSETGFVLRESQVLAPDIDGKLQAEVKEPSNSQQKLTPRKRPRAGSDSSTEGASNDSKLVTALDISNSSFVEATSVPDDEDILDNIWEVLGVGQDGYLDENQLRKVCQHIGMENTSEQVIAQLFDKLTVDQCGKIRAAEFVQLLQVGNTQARGQRETASPAPDERRNTSNSSSQDLELRMFADIDPENTGYASADRVVALWESLDIPRGKQILKDLGFNTSCQISLQELADLLDDSLHASAFTELAQVALASLRHSVQYLTSSLDQIQGERNKLRSDLDDANTHATLLAQEVDEHQTRMEKQALDKIRSMEKGYLEQLRSLHEDLKSEQESNHIHMTRLKQQMEEAARSARLEEAHLRQEINAMEEDYKRLERENKDMADEMLDTKKVLIHQQKELDHLTDLKNKIEELESGREIHLNQHYKNVSTELQGCKSENQRLQDRNDELVTEVEGLKLQLNSLQLTCGRPTNNKPQRAASWLSDYNKTAVRRLTKPSSPSPDENSEEDRPRMNRLRKKLVHTSSYEGSGTDVTSVQMKVPASRQASTSSSLISECPYGDVTRSIMAPSGSDDMRVTRWLNDVLREKEGEIAQLKEKLKDTGEEETKQPSWELKKVLNHLRKTMELDRRALMEDRAVNTEFCEEFQSSCSRSDSSLSVFSPKILNHPQDKNKTCSFPPPPPLSSREEEVEQRWKSALQSANQRHESEKERLQQSVLELKKRFYQLKEEFEDYAKKNNGNDKRDQSTECGDWSAGFTRDQATACDWSGDAKKDQTTLCDWSCSCNCSGCSSRDDDVASKLTRDCRKLQELKYSLEEDCAILELEKEKLMQDNGKDDQDRDDGDHARCRQRYSLLETSLVQQIHNSFSWYKKIEQEHAEEVERMHTLLADSRTLVNKQGNSLLQQLEKTSHCNLLVKDLYVDNCHLTAALLNNSRPQRAKTVRYYQECSAVDL